jgi:UDP-N-acetylmuramoylalanine--D-glutamate ligase
VPVTTEIRLFVERCPLPIVAISGTKGKSTTSKLLSLMLETRYKVHLGGNIGKSLLPDLPQMKKGQLVLLELSSFMLEYLGEIGWAPHVGLLTMLDCDHLEWHGTREAYLNAKLHLIRNQKRSDFAILGQSCPIAREFARQTKAKVLWYNMTSHPRFTLTIPGEHNQLNAQAAFAAAHCLGVSWDAAQKAIRSFRGLPHRLELVHQHDRIRFYNDSIATIPNAAAAALEAFPPGKVIHIVGGHHKQLSYDRMSDAIATRAKAMLVIGEATPLIAGNMRSRHPDYRRMYAVKDLDAAMRKARELAAPGDIVLLSTGCSSYDQFANFEQRGQRFADLARSLFQ